MKKFHLKFLESLSIHTFLLLLASCFLLVLGACSNPTVVQITTKPVDITVTVQPDKKDYHQGDLLDLTDLVITAL